MPCRCAFSQPADGGPVFTLILRTSYIRRPRKRAKAGTPTVQPSPHPRKTTPCYETNFFAQPPFVVIHRCSFLESIKTRVHPAFLEAVYSTPSVTASRHVRRTRFDFRRSPPPRRRGDSFRNLFETGLKGPARASPGPIFRPGNRFEHSQRALYKLLY